MSKIKDDFDEVMEYLVPVSKNEFQNRLNRKYKNIKRLIDKLDISHEVGKFYDYDARSQSISKLHISAPIGYLPLNKKLKKIGFSDYPEFIDYDREVRDEKIEEFVRDWVIYVDWERYSEFRKEMKNITIELTESDSFIEIGRDYKDKMEKLEEMEDEIEEIYRDWEEKVGESYKELSEEEKVVVDECVERLLEK